MRFVVLAVAVSLGCLAPSLALAEDAPHAAAAAKAKHGKHAKAEKKGIPADRFRQEVESRIARARDRLEHHIEKKKLGAEKSATLRNEFNAGVLQVRAKVAAVSKDGVVSRDDAREVRGLVRQIRTRKHLVARQARVAFLPPETPVRSSIVSPRSVALAVALVAAAFAPRAEAFCRSTTCTMQCTLDDNGCKTTGKPLLWGSACVGMSLSKKGTSLIPMSEVRRVVAASLATWTSLDCGGGQATIGYRSLADVECNLAAYNDDGPNANTIMFRDDDWPYQGTDNTLAFTTVTFDPKTGAILGADIEINTAYNIVTTTDTGVQYDFQSILTHELGHALGLGHSNDPSATMNAVYEHGDTSIRVLGVDDVAAICAAYPPSRKATCDPTPHGGFTSPCVTAPTDFGSSRQGCAAAGSPGAPGMSLAALGLAIALRRLRTRRRRGIPASR